MGSAAQYEKEVVLTDVQYEVFRRDRHAARSYADAVLEGRIDPLGARTASDLLSNPAR
jgi:hypothetical protein